MRLRALALGSVLLLSCTKAGTIRPEQASMNGNTVYIVHGYMASPTDHWFEWLAGKIEAAGGTATILAMPDSDAPDPQAWVATLERDVVPLDASVFVVAHSLGCIATLRFLSRHPEARIGGLIAVSGFDRLLPTLPELDAFLTPRGYEPRRIGTIAPQRAVITADDDTIVPADLSRDLAAALDAELHVLPEGGHFLGSDGFETFPLVWAELERQAAAGRRPPR